MRQASAVTALILAIGLGFIGVQAYADDGSEVRIEAVEIDQHPNIKFVVTAPQTVDGRLPVTAFRILEDGAVRDAELRHVEDTDVQVVLLIDTSGSMGGPPLAGAKDAAKGFMELLSDAVRIAVLNYDSTVTVVTDFSASREEHAAGIDGLQAGGFTATFDGIRAAVDLLVATGEQGNQIVVLLTDGEDNESVNSAEETLAALVAERVTLHSIEYRTAFGDDDPIRAMVEATNGVAFRAGDTGALIRIYERLAADLSSRYNVTYVSQATGLTELTVEVDYDGLLASDRRMIQLPATLSSPESDGEESEAAVPGLPDSSVTPPANPRTAYALLLGAGLWFLVFMFMVLPITRPRRRRVRLLAAGGVVRSVTTPGLSWLAGAATRGAEQLLDRRGQRRGLNAALERAGMNMRPGEFMVLVGSVMFAAGAMGTLLWGWVVGFVLAFAVPVAARLVVSHRVRRRQARFYEQLGDVLQLLSGSLRAGYSLLQAVDAVAREADAPASEEFGRLVIETRLGRGLPETLHAMADRMQCEDFTWVMQAIDIHREVGGDLAEILDTVAGTIRERMQIHRQVKALSAEGRVSAFILISLPFGLALVMSLVNPSYLAELTSELLGWGMLASGAVLLIIGSVWLRKLVEVKF